VTIKKFLPLFAMALMVAPFASAHVGSPNVFFEGRAGVYSVYAVIRPPAALPGAAQVSVHVREPDIRSVSLLPVIWQAGRPGSPQPIAAQPVPGGKNLWSAEVWFLRPGSYTVQVSVEGSRGKGEATVPVNALGMQSRQMTRGLRALLSVFGVFLFVGAVSIVRAVAHEGCLELNAKPTAMNSAHGRKWAGIAVLMLIAGVVAGAVRWRNMDLAYRTQWIQKPEPVAAALRSEADRVILELSQAEQSASLPSWSALVPDHGKLMHLFLVRQPELDVFAHLHPVRTDAHTFALDAPALPAGEYELYGDVTFENGISQTLVTRVKLPAPVGVALMPPPLFAGLAGELFCGSAPGSATNSDSRGRDMDDSWHVDQTGRRDNTTEKNAGILVTRLMGGYRLVFENASEVVAGLDTSLRFSAIAPNGTAAVLQPYMGMFGHAAVRRTDGSVFAHLHPSGSFSMASQEAFRQRDNSSAGAASGTLGTNSSSAIIQVRIAGRVLTGVYDVQIKVGA
jgi:hypothetical protein